jgi:hypothetical protein
MRKTLLRLTTATNKEEEEEEEIAMPFYGRQCQLYKPGINGIRANSNSNKLDIHEPRC